MKVDGGGALELQQDQAAVLLRDDISFLAEQESDGSVSVAYWLLEAELVCAS